MLMPKKHFGADADHPDAGPDAILRVPSGRNLNCPFFGAVKRNFDTAINISRTLTKGNVSSGGQGVTFQAVANDFNVAGPMPALPASPLVLVVDDVFSSGKSIAAVMRTLDPHVPEDTSYVLACPLRVPAGPAALAALGIQLDPA